MYRVLLADELSPRGIDILQESGEIEVEVETGLSEVELINHIPKFHGLVVRSATTVTAAVIAAGHNLKIIGRAGIGFDNIDVEAATQKGIIVMNAPEGNTITTAEHAISLLLALSRKIPQAHSSLRQGRWQRSRFVGVEVYQKTLGIIGLGRIGRIVAKRAHGLEMCTIGFDPYLTSEAATLLGVELVGMEELLGRADYITLHVPKTPETTHLLGARELALMKPGVRIINCARGGIVDEVALCEAIRSGRVAGAALDVFEQEPPPADHPLLQLEEVICTPHLGAATGEAQENVAIAIAEQMVAYLLRGQIRNAVNVPSLDAETLAKVGPYLDLVERLGSFQAQFLEGGIRQVQVRYSGEVVELGVKPLTIALLKGILTPSLGERVNWVNAPVLARERGITVTETTSTESADYTSLIQVEVGTDRQQGSVAGTLFGRKEPRIVRINDYSVEAIPAGYMLIFSNHDRPGIIGQIGTALGDHQINIAGMHLGRTSPQGRAVSIVNVDSPVPAPILERLRVIPDIYFAKLVKL